MDQLIGKSWTAATCCRSWWAGGMANVYKAADLKNNSTVAVKILREEFAQDAELVRRFKNESKAICILDHPAIVRCMMCRSPTNCNTS